MWTSACLALLLAALPALAPAQEAVPSRAAVLGPAGIFVLESEHRALVPGSEGIETFAWDRGGAALLATQAGELQRVELATGRRRTLLRCGQVRFPDVAPRSGRIAFAYVASAEHGAATDARWRIAHVQPDGSGFEDLGSGYDPCWSHDERELWYEDFDAHGPALHVLALATGERRRLADDAIPRHTVDRALEPGAMIWSSQRHLHAGIPGATLTCYSTGRAYDRFASFSPDARHLLFFREDERGRAGIVLRELASGGERWLAFEGRIDLASFAPAAPPSRTLEDFRTLSRCASAARDLAACALLDATRYAARLRVLRESLARTEAPALLLPAVFSLDAVEAARLVSSGAEQLVLPDLAVLEPPTARELARWSTNAEQAFLALDGLRDVDPQVLNELASMRGWGLSLGGLERLSLAQAERLASLRIGWLDLRGVRGLEAPVARALLGGSLKFVDLRGLEQIDAAARVLLELASDRVLIPQR
ncbi:MAG: hypothetical protein JNM84_15745 [Planctomycetes bacterium]|nr:hypothetical protein [Planctomycetota bacterium]